MKIAVRIRAWLPIMPLVGLLAASYWLNQQAQPDQIMPDGSKRHDPDAIVENFSATKLNSQGTPYFIMKAAKMSHYPDDDSAKLQAPRISLMTENNPPLLASSTVGTISNQGDEIFLQDGVDIRREAGEQREPLSLQTEYVLIKPDDGLMTTDAMVTLSKPNTTIQAHGMETNNKKRFITLFSQVRSKYVSADK